MPEPTETLIAGDYFLAVEGLAVARTVLTTPSAGRARVDEMRTIIENYDEFPNSLRIPLTEHEVESGYTEWAPRYDAPNPAIDREQPVVHAMLATLPVGDALDAACGTGRHAAHLAELGHRVIGIDTTAAMLDVARAKVPDAAFRVGRLEALPVDDASVDVVTCALALTHVPDLAPVMHEFARVLRPGGQAILADIHPYAVLSGNNAGFPEDITKGIPFVRNLVHHVGDYISAFGEARFTIDECVEVRVTEDMLAGYPSYLVVPEATRQAFLDTPFLLVWRLTR